MATKLDNEIVVNITFLSIQDNEITLDVVITEGKAIVRLDPSSKYNLELGDTLQLHIDEKTRSPAIS